MLLSFNKSILTEAKFSAKNIDKVVRLISKNMQRKIGSKLYRYGGATGTTFIPNGIGYLFFFKAAGSTKAFRLNYRKGGIESVTIWKRYKLGRKGDFTVKFDGLNIVQILNGLTDIIISPKTANIPVYKPISEAIDDEAMLIENENFLTEARNVKPAEFLPIVQKYLHPGEDYSSLPFTRVQELGILADIRVPTIIRQKGKVSGKGKTARFDISLTHLSSPKDIDAKTAVSKDNENLYYIKVTAQDPVSKKFLSVKDDAKALALTKQIQGQINSPNNGAIEKQMKDPNKLFGKMASLVKLVGQGNRNSLVIYGGPGTGKTFIVTKTLKDMGLSKNTDWIMVKGKITTASLYQTLFINRDKLIVFDDTDSVWGDAEASNILKAALDSYDERTISWMSTRTTNVSGMDTKERNAFVNDVHKKMMAEPSDVKTKLPSEFNYNGRIIFISNLPYEKFDNAVLTRSAKIDMTLTRDEMFMRMESILEHLGNESGKSNVPMDEKKEVLEFIKTESASGTIDQVSMRTFTAALDLYRSGLPDWKDLLEHM